MSPTKIRDNKIISFVKKRQDSREFSASEQIYARFAVVTAEYLVAHFSWIQWIV